MEKINVMPVVLDKKFLKNTINSLDIDNVNFETILVDSDEKSFKFADKKIPLSSFATVHELASKCKDFIWLISGCDNDSDAVKMKKFLMTLDISEDNIVNFGVSSWVSPIWVANLRYIEKRGADFFATGNEYMRDGLNLNFIPRINSGKNLGGVNLSDTYQDLRQSYLTAKYVFEHVKPGTIKFILIGLTPNSFHCDETKDFFGFQHILSLAKTTAKKPDLNFDAIRNKNSKKFSAKPSIEWLDCATFSPTDIDEKKIQILKDYIELCLANGAKPVGVVFPFAPTIRETYSKEFLDAFHEVIQKLEENYDFFCVDMFKLDIGSDCFYDIMHLNSRGSEFANALLSFMLYKKELIPMENFCDMSYGFFHKLSWGAPIKKDYNDFMDKIFSISEQTIRRKDKIKIGFVLRTVAEWCGDELYNLFEQDPRFEVTVFPCLRTNASKDKLVQEDFFQGVERFKSRGLNVVAVERNDANIYVPPQDVLIFLAPYSNEFPVAIRDEKMTPKTLVIYIPYAIMISPFNVYNYVIFHVNWRVFGTSEMALKLYDEKSWTGIPHGLYSGHPKMDIFFKKGADLRFKWKTTQPDAKKIIWAPHWSINDGVNIATFQWNYQFMYDFAKEHPEISWVVKPHPNLLFSAVRNKIFPSTEAFKEYMKQWNSLPNAQVYTGAYYQEIFATSDGMIHDCSSFIAEYQYVNKPMIYLTRDTQKFNALGDEILKASYLVDGQDLDAIAATLQKVFIEGNDDKAAKRKKIFNKYLNYPKANGMLASEFIYKNIADALKEE
ncbi:MAG: CDP-glycerol glycerophosphotransferase family protein [Selenomonadaceae bacterium]|nr:CDP-glycerol glycerophosphotransferase family protein [Selenomonadaceae bacterium]